MQNFGNFMYKQQIETQKVLIENYKKMNQSKPTEVKITELTKFVSFIKLMDYKELMTFAKSKGVKIPTPANY
jgi:hypothetical protein